MSRQEAIITFLNSFANYAKVSLCLGVLFEVIGFLVAFFFRGIRKAEDLTIAAKASAVGGGVFGVVAIVITAITTFSFTQVIDTFVAAAVIEVVPIVLLFIGKLLTAKRSKVPPAN